MTAAIYTRYSTDRQRETSLADQAHVCQARADALGLSISSIYGDDGISGSTPVARRPEGARLVADALAGRFTVLLVEGLYRQMAFQLENALKTDVATAREVLRPLIEGARVVEEGEQVWVESETGRAAIAVGLSLGMVAGARFTTRRRTLVS